MLADMGAGQPGCALGGRTRWRRSAADNGQPTNSCVVAQK